MPENSPRNQLFYGDNLDVLRLHALDESVDLVYLDPPFNSNADYNVLFAERDVTQAAAQIKAFEDRWRWDEGAARAYAEVVEVPGRPRRVAGHIHEQCTHQGKMCCDRVLPPSSVGEESLSPNHPDTPSRF